MIIGDKCKVANASAFHHASDDLAYALRIAFNAKEMKCDIQSIGGVGNQFEIAYFRDIKVAQNASQL